MTSDLEKRPTPAGSTGAVAAPPAELTSFIGREAELSEIRSLLASSRLVTLTGAGGSGKSRLAREVVEGEAAARTDAVAWAELASIEDPAHLVRQVAEACGIAEEVGTGGQSAALVRLLAERSVLLVMDNCEHLIDASAELADTLLKGCPRLRILATSREALGIRGERAWLVPAMSLPAESARAPGEMEGSEAVRLFVERARDVQPAFALDPRNASAVAEICRRLDGIPLAIELAAARVRVLTPEQIRSRLDDAFRLLTRGSRTAVPRHRTLRAAIDWSYELLPEEGRALLRRLSVFRGGFTLDAVEAVGAGGRLDGADVLDVLSQLVDRSLVAVREQTGEARYSLLETVRQYAAQQLAEAGEEADARNRHARWLADAVALAEPHFIRAERRVWVERLAPELDNIREALSWSRAEDPVLHVRLVGMLWWFWYSTRHWTEARAWLEGALPLSGEASTPQERASLAFAAGALGTLQGRPADARPLLEEALRLAQEAQEPQLEAYALNYLGLSYAGDAQAIGKEYSARAAAWFDANGDLYGLRLALLLQGTASIAAGDLVSAERFNLEGVRVARAFGLDRELAISLTNLSVVYLHQRDFARAEPVLREALGASRRDPSYFFIATQLQFMSEILGHLGQPLAAARILGAALALREAIGSNMFRLDRERLEGVLPGFKQAAGEEAFAEALAEGRRLTPEAAIDEVLAEPLARVPVDAPVRPPAVSAPTRTADAVTHEPEPSHVPDLRVRALGAVEVEVSGRALGDDAWTYAKPRELLVYLLMHPEGRSRDQVGQALWPEATPAQMKNSFHVTLHHLRKTLGSSDWVAREGERYLLSPGLRLEFDASLFEQQIRSALQPGGGRHASEDVLRSALALYRGEFMQGEVGGRWREDERDRLRGLYVRGSLMLGSALDARGAHTEAADLYHRLVLEDELNEEVHRRLMLSWARAGERARALKHFDSVARLLREQLDAEPEPETVEVRERIRRSDV